MISILKGNICEPTSEGNKLIIHGCNSICVMGSGVAKSLYEKWPVIRQEYMVWGKQSFKVDSNSVQEFIQHRQYEKEFGPLALGNVQFIEVEPGLFIGNCITQKGVGIQNIGPHKMIPFRYESFEECLYKVLVFAEENNMSVHAPLIGSGLAFGDLFKVLKIFTDVFARIELPTYLYSYSDEDWFDVQRWFRTQLTCHYNVL